LFGVFRFNDVSLAVGFLKSKMADLPNVGEETPSFEDSVIKHNIYSCNHKNKNEQAIFYRVYRKPEAMLLPNNLLYLGLDRYIQLYLICIYKHSL